MLVALVFNYLIILQVEILVVTKICTIWLVI